MRIEWLSRVLGGVLIVARGLAVFADDVAAPIAVKALQGGANVFAGRASKLQFQMTSRAAVEADLAWSVSVERAVIARGEKTLSLIADRGHEVPVEVEFPGAKPGAILKGLLTLDLRARDGVHVQRTTDLYVFSPDIGSHRQSWLESLDIRLFDPRKATAAALTDGRIPYRMIPQADELPSGQGLMIYGEGIAPERQAAVWSSAMLAAQKGRQALVLGSSGSVLRQNDLIPGGNGGPAAFSVRKKDVIRGFDKRLDADQWQSPGRIVAASLHWGARDQSAMIEFQNNNAGWPFLDIRYPKGGRLIWVGFGIVESWQATPAARYLLLRLLEDIVSGNQESEGTEHATKN